MDRDRIISAVYEATEGVSDNAIDSMVFRLRQKIGDDAGNPVYLFTVRGRGFRLTNVS
jgi:DNA-binding response OmpR family regulator